MPEETIEQKLAAHIDWFGDPDNPDQLDPDLEAEAHIYEGAGGFTVLQHPLVIQVPYSPSMNRVTNRIYRSKVEAVQESVDEKNWERYLLFHERPFRRDAFHRISQGLTDNQYWDLLRYIWSDSENIWQWEDPSAADLLTAERSGRYEHFMTDLERTMLDGFQDEFPVHRGYNYRARRNGWSWTVERRTAEWFAKRFAGPRNPARVAHGVVSKSDVLAYIDERGEYEIIVDPAKVREVKEETL